MKKFDDVYDLAAYYADKWKKAYFDGTGVNAIKVRMQFKRALLRYVGLDKHPKAEKIWEMAFRREQDFGYEDVASLVRDIAEAIL